MDVVLGNKNDVMVKMTTECFCCKKESRVSFSSYYTMKDALNVLVRNGWVKRTFHETARNIWFCSEQCAFYSKKASWLELYWQEFIEKEQLAKRSFWQLIKDFFHGK